METQRHGWRAIIYDAPWARFVPGQVGVIISEDGRSCETSNDDKSSIKIEADPNIGFSDRANGHVLFTQKGSNLYDIVCLSQESGGTYEIKAEPLTVDGCALGDSVYSYSSLVRDIKIMECYNRGAWQEITKAEDKSKMISNYSEVNFHPKKGETLDIEIKGKYGSSASTTLAIISEGIDTYEYSGCEISYSATCTEKGKISCIKKTIKFSIASEPHTITGCEEFKVEFVASESSAATSDCSEGCIVSSGISDSIYEIKFYITNKYNIINCGEITGYTNSGGSITNISVDKKDDVKINEMSDNAIIVSVNSNTQNAIFFVTTNEKKDIPVTVNFKND